MSIPLESLPWQLVLTSEFEETTAEGLRSTLLVYYDIQGPAVGVLVEDMRVLTDGVYSETGPDFPVPASTDLPEEIASLTTKLMTKLLDDQREAAVYPFSALSKERLDSLPRANAEVVGFGVVPSVKPDAASPWSIRVFLRILDEHLFGEGIGVWVAQGEAVLRWTDGPPPISGVSESSRRIPSGDRYVSPFCSEDEVLVPIDAPNVLVCTPSQGCPAFCSRLHLGDGVDLVSTEYLRVVDLEGPPSVKTGNFLGTCVAAEIRRGTETLRPLVPRCRDDVLGFSISVEDGATLSEETVHPRAHGLEHLISGIFEGAWWGTSLPKHAFVDDTAVYLVVHHYRLPSHPRCLARLCLEEGRWEILHCVRGLSLGSY